MERQTAIVHNDSCLARQLGTDRQPFELFMAESMSLKPDDIDSDINNSNDDDCKKSKQSKILYCRAFCEYQISRSFLISTFAISKTLHEGSN